MTLPDAAHTSVTRDPPRTSRGRIRAVTLENFADAHTRVGRAKDALVALEEALRVREELGNEKVAEKLRARIAEVEGRS